MTKPFDVEKFDLFFVQPGGTLLQYRHGRARFLTPGCAWTGWTAYDRPTKTIPRDEAMDLCKRRGWEGVEIE